MRIWESTNGALVDFSYDAKGRQLLLHCKNDSHESLVSYYLPTKWISAVGSIDAPSFFTYRVATFAGAGYAFVRRGIGNHILHVVSEPGRDPVPVSFDGGINSYAGGGGGLYVFGSRSGEPVGIWRFDPSNSIVSCVVSNSRPFFEYARPVAPARHTVTNSEGQVLSFRIWAPPRVSSGRKYPLIIGKASTRWIGYPGGIANAGAYVVSVEQDEDQADWTDEAVPIYEHLRTRLGIDRENLFLYAASGHVPRVSALLKSHPDLWKGAILFSPGSFPDLSQLGISKLLIDCGGQDFRAEAVSKFQDEAARLGVVVTVAVHEDAGHVYTSVASLRGRDQAVLRFLFGH